MLIKLINEEGKYAGILEYKKAFEEAKTKGMDLIKINDKTNPKIFKIGNYKKYIFKKKKLINKKKTNISKEIRIQTNIFKNDYKVKLKKIIKFINKKYNIKINIKINNKNNEEVKKFKDKIIKDIKKEIEIKEIKTTYLKRNIIINI